MDIDVVHLNSNGKLIFLEVKKSLDGVIYVPTKQWETYLEISNRYTNSKVFLVATERYYPYNPWDMVYFVEMDDLGLYVPYKKTLAGYTVKIDHMRFLPREDFNTMCKNL